MKLKLKTRLTICVFASLILFADISSAQSKTPDKENISDFRLQKIKLASTSIEVEIADTPELSAKGLMFRTSLDANKGMLFIFESEEPRAFWMKNTFIPLSIGFFNSKAELIDIQDMAPVKSEMEKNPKSYFSNGPAKYALEVNQGWFKKHKIKLGAKISGLSSGKKD